MGFSYHHYLVCSSGASRKGRRERRELTRVGPVHEAVPLANSSTPLNLVV
jgi:hypothetical protein